MSARILFTWALGSALAFGGEFTVEIRNLRNDRGMVRALLFAGPAGFPDQAAQAAAKAEARAAKGPFKLVFKDVKPGRYALAVLHDENSDGKADVNFIGIPREGVGVSGVIGNSKPVFAKCVIDVTAGGSAVVAMKYW